MKFAQLCLLLGMLTACAAPPPPTTPTFTFSPPATSTAAPIVNPPSPIPPPVGVLKICLATEPQSLYRYAFPEAGRTAILAALEAEVIATTRPQIESVTLHAGDRVVDEIGRVVTLTAGVAVNLPNGENSTYSGEGDFTVPQMVVTFHLQPNVVWSDGEPLTARDSVFAFDVARDPESFDPQRAKAERTASYTMLDDRMVVWTGLPGYLDPEYALNFWPPLPHHRYPSLTPVEIAESAEANDMPLGWGPFVQTEWIKGERLTLTRNPYYFRTSEGLPRLSEVTYRFVPSDGPALVTALRNGDCDLAPEVEMFSDLATVPSDLQTFVAPSTQLRFLLFNVSPAEGYQPAINFSEPKSRRALAVCLDRRRLASDAEWLTSTYSADPLAAENSARFEPLNFDAAFGKSLWTELGWADTDGDQLLDQHNQPLSLTLASPTTLLPLAQAIQAQLGAQCGLGINVRELTQDEAYGDWPEGVIFGRRFDLALVVWDTSGASPCELFTSAQIPADSNPGGANATGYRNAEFDTACRKARFTFDLAEAQHWELEARALFARDLPAVPLTTNGFRTAWARSAVQGFDLEEGLQVIEAITLK